MKKIIFLFIGILLFLPQISFARENVTDWYIKNFKTEITVNTDSSILVTEYITADCGNLPDKHGIFRILPTQAKTPDKTYNNPIKLMSITDFDGKELKYSTTKSSDTITWKIGDPNMTVAGENYYKIVYRIENVIRFDNAQFDELYWNLLGNFWDLEIDNFQANIVFPEKITQNNTQISYYTGYLGEKMTNLAKYNWTGANTLSFYSTQTLLAQQGITVSVAMPKNIFTPHVPGFFEKYFRYLPFLLPIIVFMVCFLIWRKYGKDPKINKTIIPEFEIPDNLSPLEMGTLMSNGVWDQPKLIPASIINFAVNGLIQIEKIEKTNFGNILTGKDYLFKNTATQEQINGLDPGSKLIFESMFNGKQEIRLSSARGQISSSIKTVTRENLFDKDLVNKKSVLIQGMFFAIPSVIFIFVSFIANSHNNTNGNTLNSILMSVISVLVVLFFSVIMSKRTEKGAELNWRIKGFKLYMTTAEKYRQQFNERENIFEKFLPYAMIFGLTKLWVKKIGQIYGEDYFKNYHPVWFVGANFASFDIDNFVSNINSISRNISSSTGSSSGFGGGGFSGGGGGGGGGGGW